MLVNFFMRKKSPAPIRRRAQERPSRSCEPLKSLHKHKPKKSATKLEYGSNRKQTSECSLNTELALFDRAIILTFLKKSLVILMIFVLQELVFKVPHQTAAQWIALGFVYLASEQVMTNYYKRTIRIGLSVCLWMLYLLTYFDTLINLTLPTTGTMFIVLHQMCLQWYKPVWSVRSQEWLAVSLMRERKAECMMMSCWWQIKGKLICLQKVLALDGAILVCMCMRDDFLMIFWEMLQCAWIFALLEGYFLILNLTDGLILSQINSLHGQSYVSSALLRLDRQEQTHTIQKECLKSIASILHSSSFHMTIFTKRFRPYLNKQLSTIHQSLLCISDFPLHSQILRVMRMMNELSVSVVISIAMSELFLEHNFQQSAQTAQKIEKLLGGIHSCKQIEWGLQGMRASLCSMIEKVNK